MGMLGEALGTCMRLLTGDTANRSRHRRAAFLGNVFPAVTAHVFDAKGLALLELLLLKAGASKDG